MRDPRPRLQVRLEVVVRGAALPLEHQPRAAERLARVPAGGELDSAGIAPPEDRPGLFRGAAAALKGGVPNPGLVDVAEGLWRAAAAAGVSWG